MVNSKYSMGIYKSVKINNGTDIKCVIMQLKNF